MLLACVSGLISALLLEGDRVVPGQERYNMATFMVLFLLITIEVVVVKVVTADMERDEDSHSGLRAAATFFDREDWAQIADPSSSSSSSSILTSSDGNL